MGPYPVRACVRKVGSAALASCAVLCLSVDFDSSARADGNASGVRARFEIIEAPASPTDSASVREADAMPTPVLVGMRGRRVFWARVTMAPASTALRYYIVPHRGWKKVQLFDGVHVLETGVDVPIARRAVPQGRATLPLALEPSTTRVVAMRFEGVLDGWEPPLAFLETIEPAAHAERVRQQARLVLGLYAGLLLALTFVNLLFGRVLRDPLYVDYVLYAVPYASIWLAHDFIGAEAFWPNAPWIDNTILFVVICASIVLGNRFAMRFLGTRTELPHFHRALIAVNIGIAFVVVLAAFGMWRYVPALLGIAALATSGLYIVAGIILARLGSQHARIFSTATGMLAVGTIIYTLADFDILPKSPLTEYSAQIGSAVEMLMLAFALADRVRIGEQLRRAAEERLRSSLEREVEARTTELEHINDKLIELNQQLEAQSLTDALTGIANRRRFESAIEDEWRRAQREHAPLSLLLVDVDRFKVFNDEHGHQAGDECLRRVARTLASGSRRAGDLLARYGGEEFVLILPNTPLDVALAHAERLRIAVSDAPMSDPALGAPLHVTVSIGAASIDGRTATGDPKVKLVEPADEALYRAKDSGRNRVVAESHIVA